MRKSLANVKKNDATAAKMKRLMFIGGGCISPNERLRTIPENSARAAYAIEGQHLLIRRCS
jgi:hypothetical protein